MPTRLIGACMGLGGFALAIVAGLVADNPTNQILIRAILSMLGCQLVGLAIGAVAEMAIDERSAAHRAAHPMDEPAGEGSGSGPSSGPVMVV